MTSASDKRKAQERTYDRRTSVVFLKTKEAFGGLSNMAAGYPLCVAGTRIRTAEALYQACRFPHMPEVQQLIIEQRSPMTAKMKGKPHRAESRADWDQLCVKIMRWCLRVKLAQNWNAFSSLLLSTGDRPIVEESRRDAFWGAKPAEDGTLTGMNVLGRLLMELRQDVKEGDRASLSRVEPLGIPEFRLLGRVIGLVSAQELTHAESAARSSVSTQQSLFESEPEQAASSSRIRVSPVEPESMLTLKPYPKMKDSGVPLLGQVPEHWEVLQLGRFGRFFKGNGGTKEDEVSEGVPCVRYGDLYTQHRYFIERSRSCVSTARASVYTPLRYGDVLFAASGETIEEIGKSAVNLVGSPACCGGDVVVFRPSREVDARFLGYASDCPQAAAQKSRMGRGITVMHIYVDELKYLSVALPPPSEQKAIVRFLDRVSRRIRGYIKSKRQLIQLLEEQKRAIVDRAITRGLDRNEPLKQSGLVWLGDVPERWARTRLKYVAKTQTGITLGKDYGQKGLIERPYLRVANVQAGSVDLRDIATILVPESEAFRSTLLPGDVLMTEGGDVDKLGRGCEWRGQIESCLHQNHVFAVRPDRRALLPSFLVMLMGSRHGRAYFQITAKQTTNLAATNSTTLGNFPLFLPEVEEQQAIVEWVATEHAPIDRAIKRARSEIRLLRDYRMRSVADVVSGKLDVRGAATHPSDDAVGARANSDKRLGETREPSAQ